MPVQDVSFSFPASKRWLNRGIFAPMRICPASLKRPTDRRSVLPNRLCSMLAHVTGCMSSICVWPWFTGQAGEAIWSAWRAWSHAGFFHRCRKPAIDVRWFMSATWLRQCNGLRRMSVQQEGRTSWHRTRRLRDACCLMPCGPCRACRAVAGTCLLRCFGSLAKWAMGCNDLRIVECPWTVRWSIGCWARLGIRRRVSNVSWAGPRE